MFRGVYKSVFNVLSLHFRLDPFAWDYYYSVTQRTALPGTARPSADTFMLTWGLINVYLLSINCCQHFCSYRLWTLALCEGNAQSLSILVLMLWFSFAHRLTSRPFLVSIPIHMLGFVCKHLKLTSLQLHQSPNSSWQVAIRAQHLVLIPLQPLKLLYSCNIIGWNTRLHFWEQNKHMTFCNFINNNKTEQKVDRSVDCEVENPPRKRFRIFVLHRYAASCYSHKPLKLRGIVLVILCNTILQTSKRWVVIYQQMVIMEISFMKGNMALHIL